MAWRMFFHLSAFFLNLYGMDLISQDIPSCFMPSKMQTLRKETLENLLRREGIEYYFLGAELGGFRKGEYCQVFYANFRKGFILNGFHGYAIRFATKLRSLS